MRGEALVEAERGDLVASSELLPTLVERDRDLANIDAASARLAEALSQLGNIREQNDLPRTCS